jgi:radical SAM protein with 4Fe4S-binding SPASM domain
MAHLLRVEHVALGDMPTHQEIQHVQINPTFQRLFLELNHTNLSGEIESVLSLSHVQKIFEAAQEAGCVHFTLAGGDPSVHPEFLSIVASCPEPVRILCHASAITPLQLLSLKNLNKKIEISFVVNSIETPRKQICREYLRTRATIIQARANGFAVSVRTILSPLNQKALPQIYNVMKNLRIDRWEIDFIFNTPNAREFSYEIFEERQQIIMLEAVSKIILQHAKEHPNFTLNVRDLHKSYERKEQTDRPFSRRSMVFDYNKHLTIRSNAMLSFCPELPHTFGNFFAEPLSSITARSAWQRLSNLKIKDLNTKCQTCKLMPHCGGGGRIGAFHTFGRLKQQHPFHCALQRFRSQHLLPLLQRPHSEP